MSVSARLRVATDDGLSTSVLVVLHSFGSGTDGAGPLAELIDVNGALYGTTVGGGQYNMGIVFTVTTSGSEKLLYSFL